MTGTDGRRAHDGSGAPLPPSGARWPSLDGDGAAATGPSEGPASAAPQPSAPERPSRRDLRPDTATGAHRVVPTAGAPDPRAATMRAGAAVPSATQPAATQPAATQAATTPPGATPSGDPAAAEPVPRRHGRLIALVAVIAVVVLAAGGGTAWLLLRGDDDAPAPRSGPVVELPSPTSTVAPVARPATTAFAAALPTTLLQYALSASTADPQWAASGALEAYAETYTDGGAGTVAVQAGQWETPEAAAAFLATLTAGLPTADAGDGTATAGSAAVLLQEDVLVGGQPTGTATVVDAGDGTGAAVWSNGTTVFRLTGPAADIRNLYAAYPL